MTVEMKPTLGPPAQLPDDATDAEIAMAQESLAKLEVTAAAGHETLAEFVNDNPAAFLGFQPTIGSTEIPKEFQGTFRDRAVNVWRALSESQPVRAVACAATILGVLALNLAISGKTTITSAQMIPVILQPPVFANASFYPPVQSSAIFAAREEIYQAGQNDFYLKEEDENATDCHNLTPTFYPGAKATSPFHTNASVCLAAQDNNEGGLLEEDEVMCLPENVTETVFRDAVLPQAKGRSSLEAVKNIAFGVAIASGAILKGIAAATTTAVGSIFVAGTLME